MGPNYQSTSGRYSAPEASYDSSNPDPTLIDSTGRSCGSKSNNVPCETDTLVGSVRARRAPTRSLTLVVVLIIIGSLLFETSSHLGSQCPLSYKARDRMRGDWQKEAVAQERLRHEWQREKVDQDNLRMEWSLEEKHHEEHTKQRRQREEEYEENMRQEWKREIEDHMKHQAEERLRWEVEEENHLQEMEQWRTKWQQEEENHHRAMEQQRAEWRWEVEEHDRLERERRDQEKLERQKMDMFWDQVEAHHCTTYATREYTAYLANLPVDYPHRMEACKETPLEIHGRKHLPKYCEDHGPGTVIGRWEVNHNEPDCVSFWNWFKDKGCTSEQSGRRRFEHYLENLPFGSDWREFCATTPVSFHGMHFPGAEICFQYNLGTYGHWEIEDSSC
ncbi:hypothetical protein PISMIDRAFT_672937 [Pisolithus microcarpus 441]|uniref:Uncharacterized protein n=1 Tax=Pisolithus microcarpus 441 TaxID=765257 RepID=A0A0C9ZHK9_9AGAM|nr:hypothetical protein BKA83DRAFT_672937 [Pisolithus microcarpus]KIK28766.1 hypothetical protein PISMIDRAFT_672937 [Pisolithus microcarpus 441]